MIEALAVLGAVLGLLALGGGIVAWPFSIKVSWLQEQAEAKDRKIKELEDQILHVQRGAHDAIESERRITDASTGSPAEQLRVLLGPSEPS